MVDVSEAALLAAGDALAVEHSGLDVRAVVSDFEEHLGPRADPDGPGGGRRLVALLGSTIGNMMPTQRAAFLARVRAQARPGDAFLLGTDLVKDPSVLVAAYDDSAGVTAAFNKNVLSVLNARLGADFYPDAFEHVAVWVPETEWVEMRLRSARRPAGPHSRPRAGRTVRRGQGDPHRGIRQVPPRRRRARARRSRPCHAQLVDRRRSPVRAITVSPRVIRPGGYFLHSWYSS